LIGSPAYAARSGAAGLLSVTGMGRRPDRPERLGDAVEGALAELSAWRS
jgi:hypothetical protein